MFQHESIIKRDVPNIPLGYKETSLLQVYSDSVLQKKYGGIGEFKHVQF